MTVEAKGRVYYWRGPAPFYFLKLPKPQARRIQEVAKRVSYGWGCIECEVTVGSTTVRTALIPKDGLYLVPLKAALRKAEGIEDDGTVSLKLEIKGCE